MSRVRAVQCGFRFHRSGSVGLVEHDDRRVVEITVPYRRLSVHGGIVVHRTTHLDRCDVTVRDKIPITRVARTIRDIPHALKEPAPDEAIRRKLVTPRVFADAPGLLGKLARDRIGLGTPHERIERVAIAALRRHRLPDPVRQHKVRIAGRNYRIDLAYPDMMIAIELEGEAPHWGRDRWQHDHDRSNALQLDGWHEFAFTWWDVTDNEGRFATTIACALGVRPRRDSRGDRR